MQVGSVTSITIMDDDKVLGGGLETQEGFGLVREIGN